MLAKAAVDQFYSIGLAHGPPDLCDKGVYCAFLLDLDGNNIEAIYRAK